MDIAIHLGAHRTDEDLLVRTLIENAKRLARGGIEVPLPGRARPAIRKALQSRGDLSAASLSSELGRDADRLVLSYEGFLAVYAKVLAGTTIYPEAGARAAALRALFPGEPVSFYLALRNPATFVPAVFRASSVTDFAAFVEGHDMSRIRWADPVRAIREACPDAPLTVWCNEDLPLIWPDVLHAVAGTDQALEGEDAILREVMTGPGFTRLETYLRDNPAPSRGTWRKVVTAFLGKYADEDKIDEEIALPGWSEEMIAGLSDLYERDVAEIRAMDDVTFLAP